jgi:hypothetical protein
MDLKRIVLARAAFLLHVNFELLLLYLLFVSRLRLGRDDYSLLSLLRLLLLIDHLLLLSDLDYAIVMAGVFFLTARVCYVLLNGFFFIRLVLLFFIIT